MDWLYKMLYYQDHLVKVYNGDTLKVLKTLPDKYIQVCVTSPPYWGMRDYEIDGQLGLEETPAEYIKKIVKVFMEVKRILKDDGILWLNLGDAYIGSGKGGGGNNPASGKLKRKDIAGIPWRVAFALQDKGWYLRQDIIWNKPNPKIESVKDRCTVSHEYIFLLSKKAIYYFNNDAIQEPQKDYERNRRLKEQKKGLNTKYKIASENRNGQYPPSNSGAIKSCKARQKLAQKGTRNKRSVWKIATYPYPHAHFATFPPVIPEICIKAGSREGDIVLDPFGGSGTTADVARRLNRQCISIELKPEYCQLHVNRWPNHELKF